MIVETPPDLMSLLPSLSWPMRRPPRSKTSPISGNNPLLPNNPLIDDRYLHSTDSTSIPIEGVVSTEDNGPSLDPTSHGPIQSEPWSWRSLLSGLWNEHEEASSHVDPTASLDKPVHGVKDGNNLAYGHGVTLRRRSDSALSDMNSLIGEETEVGTPCVYSPKIENIYTRDAHRKRSASDDSDGSNVSSPVKALAPILQQTSLNKTINTASQASQSSSEQIHPVSNPISQSNGQGSIGLTNKGNEIKRMPTRATSLSNSSNRVLAYTSLKDVAKQR